MKSKSLIVGAALAAGVGAANAEPLALTESQMDGVTAGMGFTSNTDVTKFLDIQEFITEHKFAEFWVNVHVEGSSAVAEAQSDAHGPNADAQTFTFTQDEYDPDTETNWVGALSKSIALVDPRPISPERPAAPPPTPEPAPEPAPTP